MVIDTDVIIRFLTNDDPRKAQRFQDFLDSANKATVTDVTMAEIYWTLSSFYKMEKETILELLESLITEPAIQCHQVVIKKTLVILKENNISYIDAYTAAWASINDGIVMSYDRGFDRLEDLRRQEP